MQNTQHKTCIISMLYHGHTDISYCSTLVVKTIGFVIARVIGHDRIMEHALSF